MGLGLAVRLGLGLLPPSTLTSRCPQSRASISMRPRTRLSCKRSTSILGFRRRSILALGFALSMESTIRPSQASAQAPRARVDQGSDSGCKTQPHAILTCLWVYLSTLMSPYRPSTVPKGKLNSKRMFNARVNVLAYARFWDLAMMTTPHKTT